jgi:hypothetical protein
MGFCEHGYETVRSRRQRMSSLTEQTWRFYREVRHVNLIRYLGGQSVRIK